MIGYLEGKIIHQGADVILLLSGHIGYEVMLTPFTMSRLADHVDESRQICLHIFFHVTERQPKPVLIGFSTSEEKAFFQLFLTVSAIGPVKAVKALNQPVAVIARAISEKNTALLSRLPGIGTRTAEKIVATLHGKTELFAGSPPITGDDAHKKKDIPGVTGQVAQVLTEQLGHTPVEARRMIQQVMQRFPDIRTPEALLNAIYLEKR